MRDPVITYRVRSRNIIIQIIEYVQKGKRPADSNENLPGANSFLRYTAALMQQVCRSGCYYSLSVYCLKMKA